MIVIEYSLLGNLVSYTIVAVIDLNGDQGRIRECPHCLEYGFHYRLGPKIKKEDEPRAPDDDQFLSCLVFMKHILKVK